jgi:hypothetical protein
MLIIYSQLFKTRLKRKKLKRGFFIPEIFNYIKEIIFFVYLTHIFYFLTNKMYYGKIYFINNCTITHDSISIAF